jgi:hypothetical protein
VATARGYFLSEIRPPLLSNPPTLKINNNPTTNYFRFKFKIPIDILLFSPPYSPGENWNIPKYIRIYQIRRDRKNWIDIYNELKVPQIFTRKIYKDPSSRITRKKKQYQ